MDQLPKYEIKLLTPLRSNVYHRNWNLEELAIYTREAFFPDTPEGHALAGYCLMAGFDINPIFFKDNTPLPVLNPLNVYIVATHNVDVLTFRDDEVNAKDGLLRIIGTKE